MIRKGIVTCVAAIVFALGSSGRALYPGQPADVGPFLGMGPAAANAAGAAVCPHRGGTLRVGLNFDFVNLDPDVSTTLPDREAWKEVFNTLVGLTANLELVPELAESWDFESGGTRIVFHLRRGVKFQDGTDFNAQAVKFEPESGVKIVIV